MLTPKLSHIGLMKTLPKVTKSAEAQKMRRVLAKNASGKGLVKSLEQQQVALLRKLLKAGAVGYANEPVSKRTIMVEDGTGIRILGLDGSEITRPIPVAHQTVAFSLSDFVNMLATPDFEGLFTHMYLDTGGNVTIGIGHLIPSPAAAVALHNSGTLTFLRRAGRARATNAEVAADYNAVLNANGSNNAAGSFAKVTSLIVSNTQVRALALSDATSRLNNFMHSGRYPEFATYPVEAQMVVMDMIYNLGLSGFLSGFPKFENAVKHRDWRTAKAESTRTNLSRRNVAVAALLDAAARRPSERYFISTDAKKVNLVKVVTPSGKLMAIKAP